MFKKRNTKVNVSVGPDPEANLERIKAIQKLLEKDLERLKAANVSHGTSTSHWYTSPNQTYVAARGTGASSGYAQGELDFGPTESEKITELEEKVSSLEDGLAAAWEAITDLQNSMDDILGSD